MKEDTRKELSDEADRPLTREEEAGFFRVVEALQTNHAIDQARKGNTLFLIDYLRTAKHSDDALGDYLLDILLHEVPVPKLRPAVEKAHHEYAHLAFQMAALQFMGLSSEAATRALEDEADHSKLERARRRHPWRRNLMLANFYLSSLRKNPAAARAAIEEFYRDTFPNYPPVKSARTKRRQKAGGTK